MAQTLATNINCAQEQIDLCGESFYAHPTGALIWQGQATLIVSDLYLRSGPVWNALEGTGDKTQVNTILTSLQNLIETHNIKMVIAIGQGFRRLDDPYHISNQDLTTLYHLQKQVEWVWAIGPIARQLPNRVGGLRTESFEHTGIVFRARPRAIDLTHEIAGGMFPLAKVVSNGKAHELPCFVFNNKRLMMPAFGGKTGACNILNKDYLRFFGHDQRCVQAITNHYTMPVPAKRLVA